MICQSVPGLLIALLGVLLSGKKLDTEQTKGFAQRYPLLLLSNCMLTFKGNTELIFALHLSSFSQRKDVKSNLFLKYACSNASIVCAQAIAIGLTLGILGFARDAFFGRFDPEYLARIVFVCVLAAILSSLVIVIALIPAVLLSVHIGINPDNVMLPIISSAGDLLDIVLLANFLERFENCNAWLAAAGTASIIASFPLLVYGGYLSDTRVPLQSGRVLALTYVLSASASFAVQFLSKTHVLLAAATPIFCGLSGAVSYIYLNRRITSLQTAAPCNRKSYYISLIITAVLVSEITALTLPFFGINIRKSFNVLFVLGFTLSVTILLRTVEILLQFFSDDIQNAGVASVPIITSIADFIGTVIIITTSIIVKGIP